MSFFKEAHISSYKENTVDITYLSAQKSFIRPLLKVAMETEQLINENQIYAPIYRQLQWRKVTGKLAYASAVRYLLLGSE